VIPAVITVNLAAAGLTHAKGKSDKCGDEGHDIAMDAVTDFADSGLASRDDYDKILQDLHGQAHPDGTAFWENCRERGCAEAAELGEN
jgi:hypothetical protein